WEQVAEPVAGHRQEAPVTGMIQKDLRDRQTDDLRVAGLGRAARANARRKGIVHQHIKCGQQGVEVGVHEASKGRRCRATPTSAPLLRTLSRTPNMESTIYRPTAVRL